MNDRPTDPTALPIFGEPTSAPSSRHGVASIEKPAHALAGRITTANPQVSTAPHEVSASAWGDAGGSSFLDAPVSPEPSAVAVDAPTGARLPAGIDWKMVAEFRGKASTRLAERGGSERTSDPEAERELGKAIIQEILDDAAADLLHDGKVAWSEHEQQMLAKAVYDALFGYGRFQPLMEDDEVENIIVTPHYNAWVEKITGELVKVDPVADSDQELRDNLAFIATSRTEGSGRSFSPVNPHLHMRLDDGSRLAAASWVTANTSVVIRRHRLRRVSLDDLVGLNMISPVQASFLRAAVRARKSIVVAGPQGAGKTTLVRALCAEIPRYEQIGTFETEFELLLHELRDVHDIVHAWEARPGSGEIAADGRQAGEFTLDEAIYNSFRFNLSRQIVGEVRGPEVWAMIKAMESGAGSISTTHAADGVAAIRKLVTCAMEAGPHVTRDLATSKLAETVDLVVQVGLRTRPLDDEGNRWQRSRWVSEIVHIAPGEEVLGYAHTHVFRPNPDGGPAIPGVMPDDLRELEDYGFDLTQYLSQNGREQEVPR